MPTMTYDPTPADQPEFTADELDSLQVGENLQEAEAQLLAGKYENAQQLEKAYLELQQKLGSNEANSDAEVDDAEDNSEAEEEEQEFSPTQQVIQDAWAEYEETGELNPETMDQFKSMSSSELVEAYMAMQDDNDYAPESRDITDQELNQIVNFAGGEEQYNAVTQWAGENMAEEYIDAFDSVVDSGDPAAIQLALAGLMATYYEQNGYEGRMYTGKGAADQGAPVFRSQAEVVAAMNDPRYDTDPAYRNDVFEALERSNIEF